MNREEALALLNEHLHNKNLLKHSLAVEACMAGMATRLGEDAGKWALAGLLHDLDYEYTLNEPEAHTQKTAQILLERQIDEEIVHAVKAHNRRVQPQSKMDWSLLAVDPTTGFIIACALMHPEKKLNALDLPFVNKRFKEKSFAKGASREQMMECKQVGLDMDVFLPLCLDAMKKISPELGL